MIIATSATKEGLEKLINKHFFSTGYKVQNGELFNQNFTPEKLAQINRELIVKNARGRWQLHVVK